MGSNGQAPTASRPVPASTAATRREGILAAALELFVAQGYLGTTMDDLGAAVNLRGPSLCRTAAPTPSS
jgi:AcrR family transcriptional regulator